MDYKILEIFLWGSALLNMGLLGWGLVSLSRAGRGGAWSLMLAGLVMCGCQLCISLMAWMGVRFYSSTDNSQASIWFHLTLNILSGLGHLLFMSGFVWSCCRDGRLAREAWELERECESLSEELSRIRVRRE